MIALNNTNISTTDYSANVAQSGQTFVVLGGGIAGLAVARELLKRGHQVTLIEKGVEVGGLARTFSRDGFHFDIGGHRFHSNNPTVVQWLKDLMKSDLLVVPRISHIYLNNQFVNYPIQLPGALSIFPPLKALGMVVSYLAARFTQQKRQDISFEDWVIKRYGNALYQVFFKPYTEKVWGIPCHELSAAWASQRIGVPSFWNMIKNALFPPKEAPATAISEFYYPRVGFGMIPEALKREILDLGGVVYTKTTLTGLQPDGNRFFVSVQHGDGTTQTLETDQVVSTVPLDCLLQAIPEEFSSQQVLQQFSLDYRDMVCLFIALNKKQVSQDSWTYFPLQQLVFGRTHEPKNWSAEMVPSDDYTSLAVEIFSSRGENLWAMSDDEILNLVIEQMNQIGWINKADVHRSWVLRVPCAYPVYRIGYEQNLAAVKTYLSQWPNLHLVGRTGAFRYMNSDGVIEDVFRFMDELFPENAAEVKPLTTQVGRWM